MIETNAEPFKQADELLVAICEMGDGHGKHKESIDTLKWLIEQAERAQELEEKLDKTKALPMLMELEKRKLENAHLRELVQKLGKKNMGYKRALKHITVFPTHFSHDQHSKRALKIARKALKGTNKDGGHEGKSI